MFVQLLWAKSLCLLLFIFPHNRWDQRKVRNQAHILGVLLPPLPSITSERILRLPSLGNIFLLRYSQYGCESWTIKKAKGRRIAAFELWCWRRLLRVPGTARRTNQSILKENSPEYSLEGLMLKLKLQYFGYLLWRTDSLEKTLMLGEIEGVRRRGRQDEMVGWHQRLNGHEFEQL